MLGGRRAHDVRLLSRGLKGKNRGKTPPKASSYQGDAAPAEAVPAEPAAERWGWQCTLCGYIEEGYPDGLPEDYACPICGVGREMFERVRL